MSILETVAAYFGLLLITGFFSALIYVCLFRSKDSNMPLAAQGLGIVLLAAALKLIFLVLANYVYSGFSSDWIDGGLIALCVVGIFMLMSGLGKGD